MAEQLKIGGRGGLLGILERASSDPCSLRFWYDPVYSAWKHAMPLSITMPVPFDIEGSRRVLRIYEGPQVYSWFLNLLPEDEQLPKFANALNQATTDVFGILAKAGGDLGGAVRVAHASPSTDDQPHYELLSPAELAAALRRVPSRPLLAGENGVQMSAAGHQPKTGVRLYPDGRIAQPKFGAASTHILKPEGENTIPGCVENELFCLRLAKAVGLNAVDAMAGVAEEIQYLCVKRYDRENATEEIVARLHQEDLCQATGLPPSKKYQSGVSHDNGTASLAKCFQALQSGVPHPEVRSRDLLNAVIFNVLIDNTDAHAKNYSLVFHDPPRIELAPLYDLMHTTVYGGIEEKMAMFVGEQKIGRHIRHRHWERFARTVGCDPETTVLRVEELARKTLAKLPIVTETVCAEVRNSDFVREVSTRVLSRCKLTISNLSVQI
ncbi:HipA domain-containing protein [Belnapia sp. T18]|uniref:HipA domain-containing protein n=1 Tax=Belnapia arida TaxID=2804533 RepID=A0ABS1UC88_9PROT|nr:HipA domain-containing protein [Belnapia arida]MBL6082288.1 HipA domain-containing protein [Belnapia arida]